MSRDAASPESAEPAEGRPSARPRVWVGRGARCVEERLVERVSELLPRSAEVADRLARPIRIVVPSHSLRLHVAAVLVQRLGAVAGLSVSTLHGAALGVLERAGEPTELADALLPVWVHRFAREEPALRDALEGLVGGYDAVDAAVRDLLDAGLRGESEEPLLDALSAGGPAAPGAERVAALVRVAERTRQAFEERGLLHRSALLARAAELVAERGPELLPSRAVLVHGFADATGVMADWVAALQTSLDAEVWIDRPPEPLRPEERVAGDPFGESFRDRVIGLAGAEVVEFGEPGSPRLTFIEAPGQRAQWRAAAERVRSLIDGGARPERIAIVARRLEGHESAARVQLERAAVPFSGVGAAGPGGANRRRIQAFLSLLGEGDRTPADRWLDARGDLDPSQHADLRLALRASAAARLVDVASLEVKGDVALPVRTGLEAARDDASGDEASGDGGSAGDDGPAVRAPRRCVAAALVRGAVAAADRSRKALSRVRAAAQWREHVDAALHLLDQGLGWAADDALRCEVDSRIAALQASIPDHEPLTPEEWASILTSALDPVDREPLGGRGGGVSVLSVTEARARTFDHLVAVDVRRGAFPRPVREDPLLPDAWRIPLRAVLPDLPLKGTGVAEERHLFAQLLAASPDVTICWPSHDDEGRPLARSSLVERMARGIPDFEERVRSAPGLLSPPPDDAADLPRTALDWAIWRGLDGGHAGHASALEASWRERALWEPRASCTTPRAPDVAAARDAIVGELDRAPHDHMESPLGPFFGLVGSPSTEADPRRRSVSVTLLEAMAHCGWKTFVERLLRIESTPDPSASLPEVDARLIGSAVHAFLDDLAREALGSPLPDSLEEATHREPVAIAWPEAGELERRMRIAAARTLEREGMPSPGLQAILVARMGDFVESARALDSGASILASELAVEVPVDLPGGRSLRLSARVDRIERGPGAAFVLIDFKTGKPLSTVKSEDLQDRDLKRELRSGRWLQAALYAHALEGALGRYAFLKPGLDDRLRRFDASSLDPQIAALLAESVAQGIEALEAGAFVPRLHDPEAGREPDLCRRCEVAEACLRGDTAMRRRLEIWTAAIATPRGAGAGTPPALRAAAALERRRWRSPESSS